jgi:voltage-gated potassium channel
MAKSHYPSVKEKQYNSSKEKWHHIIFGADTVEGRRFDIWLLWAILFSILAVMADSVPSLHERYSSLFKYLEYFFTAIFTIEYLARLYVSDNSKSYIFSFYGIIDLISTLPTYLSFFFPATQLFRILRTVRLLRVFKVLRLTSFMGEAQGMGKALKRSGAKITVFFGVILIVVVVMGAIMFVIEPPEAGFTSIPQSIYWAIVTLTTVGYGDIAPITPLGQFLSAALMILGYAVIAVPTGIVSVEMSKDDDANLICTQCDFVENDWSSNYCKKCGTELKK